MFSLCSELCLLLLHFAKFCADFRFTLLNAAFFAARKFNLPDKFLHALFVIAGLVFCYSLFAVFVINLLFDISDFCQIFFAFSDKVVAFKVSFFYVGFLLGNLIFNIVKVVLENLQFSLLVTDE